MLWLIVFAVGALFLVVHLSKKKPQKPSPMTSAHPRAAVRALSEAQTYYRTQTPCGEVTISVRRAEGEAVWRRRGQVVQIGDISISGGLIYVGSKLRTDDWNQSPENCLINPSLEIAKVSTPAADQTLNYWPSYAQLYPSTRRAYLEWLASDRNDPSTAIGYVFLYFYGIERRLMLDQALNDRDVLLDEVKRLLTVYGANHSFKSYAQRLLDAAGLAFGEPISPRPIFQRDGYELPTPLLLGLGDFAARHEPIMADWVLSWVVCDPMCHLRTPAMRDLDTFRAVFARRWDALKPNGVTFTEAQLAKFPKMSVTYRAASNTFTTTIAVGDAIPNVSGARHVVNRAHQVALQCCDELDSYSRLIGRRPELKGSIAAGALLPSDVTAWSVARDAVSTLADRATPLTVAEVVRALEGETAPEKITGAQWPRVAVSLGHLGFGVTPDPEITLPRITGSLPATIYSQPIGSDQVPDSMSTAALVLQIGTLIAVADGVVAPEEREQLCKAMMVPGLDARQLSRLQAQTEWLLASGARPSDLKGRLATISPEVRTWVVDLALNVARSDGRIVASEVKALEKVFGWLDLPVAKLYSALNGDDPVEVASAVEGPAGQNIPLAEPKRRLLNAERIAAIARESTQSAALLQAVFAVEEEEASAAPPPPVHEDAAFPGLSAGLARFAERLCERDSWPKSELAQLAATHDVMYDGALDRLNDWALDRWDDLLVEDGDPVRVNRALLTQAMEA